MRAKILFFILLLTIAYSIYLNMDFGWSYIDENLIEQQKRDVYRMSDIKEISNALSLYHDDFSKYPIYNERWNCITDTSDISRSLVWDYLHKLPKDSNPQWNEYLCPDNLWTYYYYPFFYNQTDHFILCANVEFKLSANQNAKDIWDTISKIKEKIDAWESDFSLNKMKDMKSIEKISNMKYQLYCTYK